MLRIITTSGVNKSVVWLFKVCGYAAVDPEKPRAIRMTRRNPASLTQSIRSRSKLGLGGHLALRI